MTLYDKIKPYIKVFKIASLISSGGLFVAYHFSQTCKTVHSVLNTRVLDREKKYIPEYIYIEDPSYSLQVEKIRGFETSRNIWGLGWLWKSLKHSLAWRLLWLCKHGNREQRNIALTQLASFKTNKDWDCLKLAQAMDHNTAVLLARTQGADLRYFLPPPVHIRRAAKEPRLLSYKFLDMIVAVHKYHSHTCIQHFLQKHFPVLHDEAGELDSVPAKPNTAGERDLCILCLDALNHHMNLFYNEVYENDDSSKTLISLGLLRYIAEVLERYPNDAEIDMAVIRLLTVVSIHKNLLKDFFQNGLIRQLVRLIKSKDVCLSSSAAVCLSNLSGETCYRPGLYILHPIYRTTKPQSCDILLVHGLRGGVFVTWRQRDRSCGEPLGIIDATMSHSNVIHDQFEKNKVVASDVSQPKLRAVLEDLIELENESFLSDVDVILQDIPIRAKRESQEATTYLAIKKHQALSEEISDRRNYTYCWPKDWLPGDCSNLRILGVNYWSSLSEWLERCPLQTAKISTRASELAPALVEAGVGAKSVPIIWLAHSMGGLIVKQLLVDAAKHPDPSHKKICENTKAVLFFSTPHKGSVIATMPRAISAFFWPSDDVRQLQINSPVLIGIHNAFIKLANRYKWETISFAESKPTLVTAFKVPVNFVEPESADLGKGVFYELPLDHLCICKPASRQSILYTALLDVLLRVTEKKKELHSHTYMSWLTDFLSKVLRFKPGELLETDETKGMDGLRWYEQVLIDAFTDGFTD